MKITDFALIFIGITLPIIIVVYVNVSFTIKAEEQEMYYNKLITSAIEDATAAMKEVENTDKTIDYGYSGEQDKKVSINPEIAKNTFFNSLYNNFGIKGNDAAEKYLQLFVPAMAIIDYNGVYISSIEEYNKGGSTVIEHTVKPKKYYTYSYYIVKQKNNQYSIVSVDDYKSGTRHSLHTIEFTMDDYVTHRGGLYDASGENITEELPVKSFYLADTSSGTYVDKNGIMNDRPSDKNNADLFGEKLTPSSSRNIENVVENVVNHLKEVKDEVIIKTITDEVAYAVNQNNFYASQAGITYDFVFPTIEQEEMKSYINDVGIFAFMQGLSIGNKYLNSKAYSVSRLELTTKYYLTLAKDPKSERNLYHATTNCQKYTDQIHTNIIPEYLTTKQQAASVIGIHKKNSSNSDTEEVKGFYPCPVCNP